MFKKSLIFLPPLFYLFILLLQIDRSSILELGRHLTMGKIILACHCVPGVNTLSYTYPNYPWVQNEWLSEAVFYLSSTSFGLTSILWLEVLCIFASFALVYWLALKKGGFSFWTASIMILAVTTFLLRFRARPEIFSYLFLAIFIRIIEKYDDHKNTFLLYLLPILEVIWVNTHGFFIFGPIILGSYLVENIILHRQKINKSIIVSFLLTVFAMFLNPFFSKAVFLPITSSNYYGTYNDEQESLLHFLSNTDWSVIPLIFKMSIITFTVSFVLFFALIIPFYKKIPIRHLLLSLFLSILSIAIMRLEAVFALLTLIPFALCFKELDKKIRVKIPGMYKPFMTVVGLGVFVVVMIEITQASGNLGLYFEQDFEKGFNFYLANNIQGPVFNDYDSSGYATYKLYPKEKDFVFAVHDAFPPSFWNDYNKMLSDPTFFDAQARKYNINSIIVARTFPTYNFITSIGKDKNFIPIYRDNQMVILVRNVPKNQTLVQKYKISNFR